MQFLVLCCMSSQHTSNNHSFCATLEPQTPNMHLPTDPDPHPGVQPPEAEDAQEGPGKQPLGVLHCGPSWWRTLPCGWI